MCASLILATLADSGPAEFPDLWGALGAAKALHCGMQADLHALVHQGKVSVSLGVYALVKK